MAFNLTGKSGSPILTEETFDRARAAVVRNGEAMTMSGFTNKLITLVALTIISAAVAMNTLDEKTAMGLTTVCAIVGFLMVLAMSFSPKLATFLAVPYAIVEGGFLSGLVVAVEHYYPGVAMNALLATAALLVATVVSYRTGLIKVNETFISIMKFVSVGVLVYALLGFASYFFMPTLANSLYSWTSGSLIGLGICVALLIFGAMSLVMDLYIVEEGIQSAQPKAFEWYCAMSILVTVVFIYVKMIELLVRIAYTFNDD